MNHLTFLKKYDWYIGGMLPHLRFRFEQTKMLMAAWLSSENVHLVGTCNGTDICGCANNFTKCRF
jgi:hypothetical protein